MLFKYIASLYLKHLFFILLALVSFFVFFDYIMVAKHLTDAVNLQLLYVSLKAMEALDMLWQLSIVFAFLTSWVSMVKSNNMVALLAMGHRKVSLFFPFVVVFIACYGVLLLLHTTEFSYAKDKSKQIRSYGMLASASANLFFKYEDRYVFFQFMFPLQQKAVNVRIIDVGSDEIKVIKSPEAFFENNNWILPEASMIFMDGDKVSSKRLKNYESLTGFKPKILESVYEVGSGFSIEDAFNAIAMLHGQGLQTDKIRSVVYSKLIIPFYFLLLLFLFFNKLPVHGRFSNMTVTLIMYILITLFVWGVLFALQKLALTLVLNPEMALIFPLILLLCYAIIEYRYKKFN